MLPSIQIRNFKNIKNLEIPNLSQVNLITGKNNTSKTSLLEAIGMWASNMDFEWIYEMIEKRGELVKLKSNEIDIDGFNSLSSLFYDRQIDYDEKRNIFIGNKEKYFEIGFGKYFEKKTERSSRNGDISTTRILNNDAKLLYNSGMLFIQQIYSKTL